MIDLTQFAQLQNNRKIIDPWHWMFNSSNSLLLLSVQTVNIVYQITVKAKVYTVYQIMGKAKVCCIIDLTCHFMLKEVWEETQLT